MRLVQFFANGAPPQTRTTPFGYAMNVAGRLGVDMNTFTMGQLVLPG